MTSVYNKIFSRCLVSCFLEFLSHPPHRLRMSYVNVPSPMLEQCSLETGTPIWPPSACILRGVASNVASSYPIPYHGALGTNRAREQPTFSITSPKSEGFGWNPFDLWASFLDSWGGMESKTGGLEPYWQSATRMFANVYLNKIFCNFEIMYYHR